MNCPVCNKNEANNDLFLGVLPCDECQLRRAGGKKLGGWKSNQSLFEYGSTPFWKHMGLKPKPHEIQQEKYMKWKGLSYHDLQVKRNKGKNARFNNSELIKKALNGDLPHGKSIDYWRQGPSRD